MKHKMPPSILGGPFPAELTAKWKAEEKENLAKWDKIHLFSDLLLEGYQAGELTIESLARLMRTVLNPVKDKSNARHQMLGLVIDRALTLDRANPGRGYKGTPQSIRKAAVMLAEKARTSEGRPLSRTPGNAYERASEKLTEAGYPGVSPTEIEGWRIKFNKDHE